MRRQVVVRYAGMGMELAASLIGLTLVGIWVDHKFGTGQVGLIVGATVGVVGGMYNFIRQALAMMKQDEVARKDSAVGHDDDTVNGR